MLVFVSASTIPAIATPLPPPPPCPCPHQPKLGPLVCPDRSLLCVPTVWSSPSLRAQLMLCLCPSRQRCGGIWVSLVLVPRRRPHLAPAPPWAVLVVAYQASVWPFHSSRGSNNDLLGNTSQVMTTASLKCPVVYKRTYRASSWQAGKVLHDLAPAFRSGLSRNPPHLLRALWPLCPPSASWTRGVWSRLRL